MSQTTDNYNLKKIAINGINIDVGNIDTLNIFEGLSNPAITGNVLIRDREALLEFHEVFAGDMIELQFDTVAIGAQPFSFKGIITSADGGIIDIENTFPQTVLHFCSEWWFKAITKQVSKCYKNVTFEEIIKDLVVNECGADFIGSYPAPTEKIERLVIPNWTVAHSIKYILNWAAASSEETGYVFFDNLIGQQPIIFTLDYLFNNNWGKHNTDLVFGTPNIKYDGNVEKIFLESYFDSMRYLNHGVYQTDYVSFDYDRTKIYTSSKNVDELDLYHLSGTMPMLKKFATPEYKSIMTTGGLPQGQHRHTEKQFNNTVDAERNNRYCNLFADMLKFNIMVPGNTNRTSGMTIKFDFPSIKSNVEKSKRHAFLEGHYLIRDIRHIFKNDGYNQAITLCRDGYNSMNRNDFINWTKVSEFEENE